MSPERESYSRTFIRVTSLDVRFGYQRRGASAPPMYQKARLAPAVAPDNSFPKITLLILRPVEPESYRSALFEGRREAHELCPSKNSGSIDGVAIIAGRFSDTLRHESERHIQDSQGISDRAASPEGSINHLCRKPSRSNSFRNPERELLDAASFCLPDVFACHTLLHTQFRG